MIKYNDRYTDELKAVFNYIEGSILTEYPSKTIIPEHFLYAILECDNCTAYRTLSRVLLTETINTLKDWYRNFFSNRTDSSFINEDITINKELKTIINIALDTYPDNLISSAQLLDAIICNNTEIKKTFELLGITINDIRLVSSSNGINKEKADNNASQYEITIKDKKKSNNTSQYMQQPSKIIKKQMNDVDRNLIDLNALAAEGKINEVIGNDDIINKIFIILQKKYKNNVVVVGKPGVGKTATIKHIANLIVQDNVPPVYKNKKLMLMDFSTLVLNTMMRGSFEEKFKSIINAANKSGNYIFFIDDIHSILSDKSKFGEVDINGLMDMILMNKNIQFICTTNQKAYRKYIEENSTLKRRLQKIDMEPSDQSKSIEILKYIKNNLETYHNVVFEDNTVEQCVKLCDRYIQDNVLPDSAIDIMDEAGVRASIIYTENNEIKNIKEELDNIFAEKEKINNSLCKNYDGYDSIIKKEIELKTRLNIAQKEYLLDKKPSLVTVDDIKEIISSKTDIPLEDVKDNDKEKLKDLEENILKYIVGQDEAVNEVCKVIKKQRLGISNPYKPPVFLFTGATGTGKTYLAKKIAEEIFGSDKYLLRFDMSEFSDRTSVSKIYGSAPGYVGYDNGGQLTEAVKNKKHCVLLLDEIEKADDDVHNVFLQLFDEGRITDNTGYTVDFKNVIIIMTSNVGMREISDKGKSIGFVNEEDNNINKDIISKAIKKKFKPEFINRINKIIFFNKLGENDLKQIIRLEIEKLEKRLKDLNYSFNEQFIDNELINNIYDKIKDSEYGAREINRKIETELEDKLMHFMLNNNIENGHSFTKEELDL